jgi:hypothetical protein
MPTANQLFESLCTLSALPPESVALVKPVDRRVVDVHSIFLLALFFTASMMPTPTIATVAIRSAISHSISCTTESSNRKVLNAKATQTPAHRSNITEMIYTGSVASATRTSSSAAGPMSPSMSASRASRAGKFDKQVQHRADHRHLPTDCIQDCCAGCVHHCTPNNQPHQQL